MTKRVSGRSEKVETVGSTQLAKILGISRQRVNELGREGKISREPDGRWDPAKVCKQLGTNLDGRQPSPSKAAIAAPEVKRIAAGVTGVGGNSEPAPGTLLYEQYRLTKAKADTAALERAEKEGTLIRAADVKTAWTKHIGDARMKLLAVGDEVADKLAAETNPLKCREMVNEKIHSALAHLAGSANA